MPIKDLHTKASVSDLSAAGDRTKLSQSSVDQNRGISDQRPENHAQLHLQSLIQRSARVQQFATEQSMLRQQTSDISSSPVIQRTKVEISSKGGKKKTEVPGTAAEDTTAFLKALDENDYSDEELQQIEKALQAGGTAWDLEMIPHVKDAGWITEDEQDFDVPADEHKAIIKNLFSTSEKRRLNDFMSSDQTKKRKAMVGGGKKAKDPTKLKHQKEFLTHRNPLPSGKRYRVEEEADPEDIDTSATPLKEEEMLIPQFRGLHYTPSGFTDALLEQHSQLDERDEPVYPTGTLEEGKLGIKGYYNLFNQKADPKKEAELHKYQDTELAKPAEQLYQQSLGLSDQQSTTPVQDFVGRNTSNFQPMSLLDTRTHFYSQSYDPHAKAQGRALKRRKLKESPKPEDELFKGLPNASNPIVSTGDIPYHSAKYAFGLKPYAGHEADTRGPRYRRYGRPGRRVVGKTYGIMMRPSDYRTRVVPHLASLQNMGRINIGKTIIPERESQFIGGLPRNRVKFQRTARYPNFRNRFGKGVKQKYGLNREAYNQYRRAFSQTIEGSKEHLFLEANLTYHLAQYNDAIMMAKARAFARRQRKQVVFRRDGTTFGRSLPKLGTIGSKQRKQNPVELLYRQAAVNGLEIVDVVPNGNCLYLALVHQLQLQGIITDVTYLRERLTTLILNNPGHFGQFNPNLNALINSIMTNYNWNDPGGDIAAEAIATVLQQPIHVLTPGGLQIRQPINAVLNLANATIPAGNPATIAYNGYNHYMSTRPKQS